jgi:hypothetical protein
MKFLIRVLVRGYQLTIAPILRCLLGRVEAAGMSRPVRIIFSRRSKRMARYPGAGSD